MPPQVTNAVILPTAYGQVMVNRYDINQTNHLLKTGAAIDYSEIDIITRMIEPDMTVIDVGACFGLWSLSFSYKARRVYTFEAQRLLCNYICGSLALNSIENVFVFNMAVGATTGLIDIPRYNYNEELQFGCVYLGPKTKHGQMVQEPFGTDSVPLVTLDSLNIPSVDIMKVDVEGMELDVLKGAYELIWRCHPVIYVETILTDRDEVKKFLEPMGYLFTGNEDNTLCVHKDKYSLTPQDGGKILIKKLEPKC